MRGVARTACLAAMMLALAPRAGAADAVFRASVDRKQVGLGDTLTLTLTVNSEKGVDKSAVTPPDTGSLRVAGTSITESTSFVLSGGTQTFTRIQSFHYVLQPTQLGTVRIGPAQLRVGGQTLKTEPIQVLVTRQPAPAPRQKPPGPTHGRRFPGSWLDEEWEDFLRRPDVFPKDEVGPDDLYVKMQVSPQNVCEGQQVTAKLKIYSRVGARISTIRWPALDDFFTVDRDVSDSPSEQTIIDNRVMLSKLIDAKALFPLRAGEAELGSAEVEVELSTNPFYPPEIRTLRTRPLAITVQELPAEGRPGNFDAVNVGRFSLAAEVDSLEVNLNQPVTLVLTLSGTGAIQRVRPPALPSLGQFRVFDSTTEVKAPQKGLEVKGSKRSEIILVPLASGELEIPPLGFSFFDPKEQRYRSLTTEKISLKVTASDGGTQPSVGAPHEVNVLAGSFQPIIFESRLEGGGPPLVRGAFFLPLLAVPPALYLLVLLVTFLRAREQQDSSRARMRRAWAEARKQLRAASRCLSAGDAENFFRQLRESLYCAVEGRLGRSLHGFTLEEATQVLAEEGFAPQMAEAWRAEVENCDSGRFAPSRLRGEQMQAALERTRALILSVERGRLRGGRT